MRRVRVRELLKSSSETDEDDDKMMMHVSLSRTFPIRKEQRDPYRARLKTRLGEQIERLLYCPIEKNEEETHNKHDDDDENKQKSFESSVLELKRMKVFVNDARTTTFVALCEKNGEDARLKNNGSGRVRDMIRAVNEVNEQFGFPKYEYEPCVIPHASFCYADGDWEEEMRTAVEAVYRRGQKKSRMQLKLRVRRMRSICAFPDGSRRKCLVLSVYRRRQYRKRVEAILVLVFLSRVCFSHRSSHDDIISLPKCLPISPLFHFCLVPQLVLLLVRFERFSVLVCELLPFLA